MQESDSKNNAIRSFEICFDDKCSAYFAGDTINGHVVIDLESPMPLHCVRLRFRGESFVCWHNHRSQRQYEYVTHHGHFWNQVLTIWGKTLNDTSPDPILTAGYHTFQFSVQIPVNNTPSSFENKYGAIRYWLVAYIDQEHCKESITKPFTVLQKVDMNDRKYQTKVSNDAEKTTCCFCFRPSSLFLSASLDRSGYCSGESIAVNCRGKNRARREMGGIKARLIQKITYNSEKSFKIQENIISAIGGNRIEPGRTKVWENQLLKIPPVPPTIENCENIAVIYKVQITMVVPNGIDLQFHLPITIGTVPMQDLHNDRINVKLSKCTEGVSCFNHVSDRHHFPLQAFVPYTAIVDNFHFRPKRSVFKPVNNNKSRSMAKIKDEEKRPLLTGSVNTYTI